MRTMSGGPCLHYDCTNRNSFGYCKTTVCINQNYQHEQWTSTTNRTEPVIVKPMTNADKYFRNATDEELAKIIVRAKYFDKFCEIVLAGENPGFCDDDCNECALDWLKQEVQDAAD